VFLAAAKVGGIGGNSQYHAEFIYQNMMIGFNVIHAAYQNCVKKLMNLGSSCIYPKYAPQPLKEESLLAGLLESTNDSYALAKISAIKLCSDYNKEYGTNFLSVMPSNLYGINDTYNLETGHVFPTLIKRFDGAKTSKAATVTLWGDGSPLREFLCSDDLADAIVFLMENYNAKDLRVSNSEGQDFDFVNVGSGKELSIKELAVKIRAVIYEDSDILPCSIEWDKSKPNGTPRKLCDVSRLAALGWRARIGLEDGIRLSYKNYLSHNKEKQ
jgi:GDP-L-fucose synthase